MNRTLTLLIPSDWPQPRRECCWLLRDQRGQVIEQGCSEAAHWPIPPPLAGDGRAAADGEALACELILAGTQVSGHCLQLPTTPRGRSPEVVAAALEDALLEDSGELQFATRALAAGAREHLVGVVATARLLAICQLLRELGLVPRSAWPLAFVLPAGVAALCGSEITLPLPGGAFFALEFDASLDDWLAQLADAGLVFPIACVALGLRLTPEDEALWQEAGRWQLASLSPEALLVPAGPGFLHGELAPPRTPAALARNFRLAGRLAAGFALATLLVVALQWGWLAWQARDYRQDIEHSFRQVFPEGPMVDPLRQLERRVDLARHAAGRLADGDFLRLAEALALPAEAPLKIQEMSYRETPAGARLQVVARLPDDDLQKLAHAARALGLTLEVLGRDSEQDGKVELMISQPAGR